MRSAILRTLRVAMAVGAACGATLASAAPVAMQNGAYAGTFVRDCRSAAAIAAGSTTPDRCEVTGLFGGTFRESQEQAMLGGFTASATATDPLGASGWGTTRSWIDASGAAGLLTLKQGAFTATDYARSSGHSLGLQSFFYDGTGPTTRRIENILDFSASVTPGDFGLPSSGSWLDPAVFAKTRVSVFSLNLSQLIYDPDAGFNVQETGFWEQAMNAGYGDFRMEAQAFNDPITSSGTPTYLDFTMEAGRWYFVESYLGLWARFGGQLDATHTFTTQLGEIGADDQFLASTEGLDFSDPSKTPTNIRNNNGDVTINVPEPGTLMLAGLSLGLLGWRRRR